MVSCINKQRFYHRFFSQWKKLKTESSSLPYIWTPLSLSLSPPFQFFLFFSLLRYPFPRFASFNVIPFCFLSLFFCTKSMCCFDLVSSADLFPLLCFSFVLKKHWRSIQLRMRGKIQEKGFFLYFFHVFLKLSIFSSTSRSAGLKWCAWGFIFWGN